MIWIAYIILEAVVQWYLIEKKKITPKYWMLFCIRGGLAVLYGAFVLDTQADTAWRWFGQIILPFAFTFNQTLNLLRGEAFDYVGENSGIIEPIIFKYGWQRYYFFFTLALFVADMIWFIRW